RLLVQGQPAFTGGPQKALKTSVLIALAASLGSGAPFLGTFDVSRPCRVVVASGESGDWAIQDTARRVCRSLDVDPSDLNIHWSFRLPQLASAEDLTEVQRGLKETGAEVFILDPLYLSLLAGQEAAGKQASNLFDVGPLLAGLARCCLDV